MRAYDLTISWLAGTLVNERDLRRAAPVRSEPQIMSTKQIVIDDHAGTEIADAQAAQTQARITIAREGTGEVVEWDALNLTDESWDLLVKTIREFFPDVEPNMSGEAHAAHVRARDAASGHDLTHQSYEDGRTDMATMSDAEWDARDRKPTANVPAQRLSQGEQRKRSQAIRTWWLSLTPAALKALGLPEAKAGPGRMPPAVTDAYNDAHSS